MVAWIDNSSHVLWNAEPEGRAPKSDTDWLQIQEHATQLAAAGTLDPARRNRTGGPRVGTATELENALETLTNAALDAIKGAKSKDLQVLVKANGQLVAACESCHREFKPNLPTEGIAHHPPHEQ